MRTWVSTCGDVDFDEPATLWILGDPRRAGPWCSQGLTLADAIREALATDPDLHPSLQVTSQRFRAPLDFDHIRALHGHADFPRRSAATPSSTGASRSQRVVEVGLDVLDDLRPLQPSPRAAGASGW